MFWRRQQVEDLALITLLDFRRRTGRPLGPPVDVELVGEIACGLRWDWDAIPEPPGIHIWAALFPSERRVVLNETHADTFGAKPGLERFTRAHEIGHWMLHVEGGRWGAAEQRSGGDGERRSGGATAERTRVPASIAASLLSTAAPLPGSVAPARPWIERHADWFAASLLMPAALFVPAAEEAAARHDLSDWRAQHRLAQQFAVTRSALRVRLNDLGLLSEA